MLIINKVMIGLIVVSTSNFAHAGSAPVSRSSIDGYFLGSTKAAYLSSTHPKKDLQKITSVCEKKGPLWAFGVKEPVNCSGIKYIEKAGDGPVYALDISGVRITSSLSNMFLYSINPFPKKDWLLRKIKKPEVQSITTLLTRYQLKYLEAIDSIDLAEVIDSSRNGITVYILPWKTISDDLSVNQYYLAIIGSEKGFTISGEFGGKIIGYVDLDGDGLPEIQLSRDCDGTCESVISVKGKIKQDVSVSNH